MKVGLVRHFRVEHAAPKRFLVSPAELVQWFADYDEAPVTIAPVDLGPTNWQRCYASDLPRAVATARAIYPGEVHTTPSLREIPAYLYEGRRLRLPFLLWAIVVRLGWRLDTKAQPEPKAMAQARVAAILDEILQSDEDVLIVSHAAIMDFLQAELKRRGFRGEGFGLAKNGRLYTFEKEKRRA